MQSASLLKWEKELKQIFRHIDEHLEDKYGHLYTLHPSRPPRGTTANNEHDGLFNVGAAFSAGYGSHLGPGYIIEVRISTLEFVQETVRESILQEVIEMLREMIPLKFPDQPLEVTREGHLYKIHGDLSLGSL